MACDELVSAGKLSYAQGIEPLALRQIEGRDLDRSRASARNGKISRHHRLVKAPLSVRERKVATRWGMISPYPRRVEGKLHGVLLAHAR